MSAEKNIYTHLHLRGNELRGFVFERLESDPDPIDGSIYYNVAKNEFRACVSGVWVNIFSIWHIDDDGNITTDKQVLIKNSLIVDGDTSSGGEGQDTPSGGISGVKVNGVTYYDDNGDGIVDLGTISGGGGTADLSNYYTKAESDNRYLASSLLGSNTLIHSGNIGSYAMKWLGGAKTGADANNYSYDAGVFGVATGANMPTASGYGAILNIPYRVESGKPDFMGQLMMPNGDESDRSMYYRTSLADSWNPWRKVISTADDGYLYGLGGYIDIQYSDEINRYGGNLYLQHRGGVGATGSGTGGTTTGNILMCAYGGNVLIGTATDSDYKLDVNGDINAMSGLRIGGCGTSYCGLYPNSQITSNGQNSKLWLYNESGLVLYGTSIEMLNHLNVVGNVSASGYIEGSFTRNAGMASTMYFTSTQWLRIWKGTYGSAVRLQIGKNYYHMDPMVLCIDASIGYSSAAISVTCNADAANMSIQAIRVTKDASGNYYIDVLIYNAVVDTDVFRVCGNSALGHIVAFETADNSATVLKQISVVPNSSIISNNLIVSGDVGIGTASPNRKFHVLSPDFTCMAVQRNQPSGYGAVIEFYNTANKLGHIGWDNEYYFKIVDTSGKSLISGMYDSLNIGDYFFISNTATNPYIRITHGGYYWYIQGYQNNYLYLGSGSTKSLRIRNDGEVYCPQNLIVSGDTSSGSDIRFKDIIDNKIIKVENIAKAPLFTFKWNDREDGTIHLGSSAQYWENIAPWLVSGSEFKSLNYAILGVAMGISLAKKTVNHEERIKVLEKEIKRLKEEMIHG